MSRRRPVIHSMDFRGVPVGAPRDVPRIDAMNAVLVLRATEALSRAPLLAHDPNELDRLTKDEGGRDATGDVCDIYIDIVCDDDFWEGS